jgi:hypothetical protein
MPFNCEVIPRNIHQNIIVFLYIPYEFSYEQYSIAELNLVAAFNYLPPISFDILYFFRIPLRNFPKFFLIFNNCKIFTLGNSTLSFSHPTHRLVYLSFDRTKKSFRAFLIAAWHKYLRILVVVVVVKQRMNVLRVSIN